MSNADEGASADQTLHLLLQAWEGDTATFNKIFERHREELRRAVARRLDRSLRSRLDPSDVIQETHREVLERLPDYMARRPMPFRMWLFRTAIQQILKLRRHALAARRSVSREQPLPTNSSSGHHRLAMVGDSTPSQEVAARERTIRLNHLLNQLAPPDWAILELRTFQGLSYEEAGNRLNTDPVAARKRYGRALLRRRALLVADGLTESRL
jgi:RNA polymerase sigma-70 factor, ECF subfamily